MRIVLRDDSEQFAIVRAFEARDVASPRVREFTSEQIALAFLHRLVDCDSSLLRMRRELEGARETLDVMRMSDRDILRAVAALLARGLLKVIVDPLIRVTLPIGLGPAEGKAAPGKAPPIEQKPAPIVPPEYIILARVESNQVTDATRKLVGALQKLMHDGFNRLVPPSQIADTYVRTGKSVAADTRLAIERLDIKIGPLAYIAGALTRPKAFVPTEYATLGEAEGKFGKQTVLSFAAGLKALLWEPKPGVTFGTPKDVDRGKPGELDGALETGPAALVEEDKKPDEKPPEEPIPKSSIVFKVLWAGTGAPVRSVQLKIKLPTGNETVLSTNTEGEVKLAGIQAGECQVRSDIKGATRRDVLDISGSSMGAPDLGLSSSAKYKLAKVEHYKVKTGDTLDSLAAKAGMSKSDLAKFNWGTDDPQKINQALRLEVGSTKKGPDGKTVIFDDADSPGIVYLPKPLEELGLATGGEHVFTVAALPGSKKWIFSW